MQSLSIKKFLSTTITIERQKKTKDSFGGVTVTWDKKDWGVKARIYDALRTPYIIAVEGADYSVTAKLIAGKDANLTIGDRITDEKTNEVYILVRIYNAVDARNIHHIEGALSLMDV
jgi:hypothetical protein